MGGGGFRKFGVVSDYWKATGSKEIDKGRFGVTNDSADLYKFKVAGLRGRSDDAGLFPRHGSVERLAPRRCRSWQRCS